MSNYKPESEVSRLNRKGDTGKTQVSPELYELLVLAKDLSIKTAGVFDVTVGPLVDLWQSAGMRKKLHRREH